nr:MAG TPA: hypothetical protein [Caudoviricetes sp.]
MHVNYERVASITLYKLSDSRAQYTYTERTISI